MKIFLVAGEHSGDQLGFKLMQALRHQAGQSIEFAGVGGEAMQREGLQSLFPLQDIAVMGLLPVIRRLPQILARIRETAAAVIAARPDVLVLIDSPDFTHRVAQKVRKALPGLKIIDYVSPSVWAWRPGRARKMRAYVDHVLALLPFEPAAHAQLGGPQCTYVGHPLIERLEELRPNAAEAERRLTEPPLLLILPGSRRAEIERLMPVFGAVLDRTTREFGPVEAVLPAVGHLEPLIRRHIASWRVKPVFVLGEAEKLAAFRRARAALAASGTVTLELALAQVPMVVAYKVSRAEEFLRFLVTAHSIVLPNLILGGNSVPEFVQADCNTGKLSTALLPLLRDIEERRSQLRALNQLDPLMMLEAGDTPSHRAARIVLAAIG